MDTLYFLNCLIQKFDKSKPKPKPKFKRYSFVHVDSDDTIATILGITEHSNMLHLRVLSSGCCVFKPKSDCRVIAGDELQYEQKIYFAKQPQLPPLFEWNASYDDLISSYFPLYRGTDPHYNKAKFIYLKTVHLLQQSSSYIQNIFVDYRGPETFHDAPVPSFSAKLTEFGQTEDTAVAGIQIHLFFKFIHLFEADDYVTSVYDQHASIFMGSITFYHELIHWLRLYLCNDPPNIKYEGGFDAEVTNTTGLWSCDWGGDDEIFDIWHWKIDDKCKSYRSKERSAHEEPFSVDSAFIAQFVNEYKGQKDFWEMLAKYINEPDQYNKGLIRKTRGNQSRRRCAYHKYDV